MAMINCNDCGREISENALFCPQCGSAAGLILAGKRFTFWGFKIALTVFGIMGGIALVIFLLVRSMGG